jgi:hypothetical protein
MRATMILAIVTIVVALGAATSLTDIHQVSAKTPNPGSDNANNNINPNAHHACDNPTSAFHSNIAC